ncbi:ribosomal L7Ae/L30e/S12e/Gadd45 family protein [Fusibacter paucivorans]|uniref:Ribosomal L7Ae/L30e/S12e/Gadd45 family protein n=1 Tax=Fusibacter paucivorans TaxID=76009 RepID=A0ABS5PU57_9FIRM|nr:ribosomal L7Ae/L30e/S12e/Gadd45 family protein [Fusibacter paucivorans]MBS7528698.1 ribosomal L7Ae/L30e/S12e/Gadd45 family protein [Fusibacter paucivorans]
MQLEELTNNPKLVVGVKQTTKCLTGDRARLVLIAKDAEQHVVRHILELCETKSVEIVFVDSMKTLGKACNIDVGAATAVIEK